MIPAVIERCAGIDVGKKFLAVCVMTGPAKDDAQAVTRKFGTVRRDLEELCKWLQSEGCTHVVMESSGVYWKPVLNVLEDDPLPPLWMRRRTRDRNRVRCSGPWPSPRETKGLRADGR